MTEPGVSDDPVRRHGRTRARWLVVGNAIAVLLLVGASMALVRTLGGSSAALPAGHSIGRPADEEPPGWHWEYYRDIEIAVPDHWRYDIEPSADWCLADPPSHPYVAHDLPGRTVEFVGCMDSSGNFASEPPPDTWVDHLVLSRRAPSDHPAVRHVGRWTITKQPVGAVLAKVVSHDPRLGERIVSTTRVIEQTPAGCLAASPIQGHRFQDPSPPFDVRELRNVSRIVVCQYDFFTSSTRPGFLAEAVLSGASAERELAALTSAPAGGGPNQPWTCEHSDMGATAMVLHLVTGRVAHTMYAYYGSCHANGTRDGTTVRALTSRSCPPLVSTPPVYLDDTVSSAVALVCGHSGPTTSR